MASSSEADNYIPSEDSHASQHSLRKRSRSQSPERFHVQNKKSRYGYRKDYLELLNQDIADCVNLESDCYSTEKNDYYPSQYGAIYWSKAEKARFFLALDRHGKDNIRAIARVIGTKSEVEIESYLRLLQVQSSERRKRANKNRRPVELGDLQPAIEVSPECVEALADAADGLNDRQNAWEETLQRRKYGNYWRIDESTNLLEAVDEQIDGNAQHFPDGADLKFIRRAATLLQTEMMGRMSRFVFMNSRDPERQYRTYAEQEELPAIQLTALLDIYNLVVALTKRLVSTAHFMALSRVKSGSHGPEKTYFKLKSHVRLGDVEAALDAIGQRKRDYTGRYWADAVRRCDVGVKDASKWSRLDNEPDMTDVDIQRRLSDRKYRKKNPKNMNEGGKATSDLNLDTPILRLSDSDTSEDASSTDLLSDVDHMRSSKPKQVSNENFEHKHDEWLEQSDVLKSKEEERFLWHMLEGDDVLASDREVDAISARPPAPIKTRKLPEDWRKWIQYQSPWESYDSPITEEAFMTYSSLTRKQREPSSSVEGNNQTDQGNAARVLPERGSADGDDESSSNQIDEQETSTHANSVSDAENKAFRITEYKDKVG